MPIKKYLSRYNTYSSSLSTNLSLLFNMHLNGETSKTTNDWCYWLKELDAHKQLSVEAKCREWLKSVPTPHKPKINLETYSGNSPSTHLSGGAKNASFSFSKIPLKKRTLKSKHTYTCPQEKQQLDKKATVLKQQKLGLKPYNPPNNTGDTLPTKDLGKSGLQEARKTQLNKSKPKEPPTVPNLQKVPLIQKLYNKSKGFDSIKKTVQSPHIYKVQRAPKQQNVLYNQQIPNTNAANKQQKKAAVANFSKTSHPKMESTVSMQTKNTAKQSPEVPKPTIFSKQLNKFKVQNSQISKTNSPYLQNVSKVEQTVKNTKTPPMHLKSKEFKQTKPFVSPALKEHVKSTNTAKSRNRRILDATKLQNQPKQHALTRNRNSETSRPHMPTKQSNEEKLRSKESKIPRKALRVQKTTIHREEDQAAPYLQYREEKQLNRGYFDLSQYNFKREMTLKYDNSKLCRGKKPSFEPSTSFFMSSLRNVGLGKKPMPVAKEPLQNIKKPDISKKKENILNINKRLSETRDGIVGFKTEQNTTANILSRLKRKPWYLTDKINPVEKQSLLFKNTK